jgi:hypothetical protein
LSISQPLSEPIEEDARQRFMQHFDLKMQRGECVGEWL